MLAPGSVLASSDGGFYWARTDTYEIAFYDSTGVLTMLARRPVSPRDVTASDRSLYGEATVAALEEAGRQESARRIERTLRDAEFADTRPLFYTAFVDVDQRLWLSAWPWPARFVPPTEWSVFSDEGVWLGDVVVPDDLRIVDARDDRLLGVWTDEVDVAYLRVYAIGSLP